MPARSTPCPSPTASRCASASSAPTWRAPSPRWIPRPARWWSPPAPTSPRTWRRTSSLPAKAVELMETAAPEERVLGADPHTGHTVVAKNGRYGAYVTEIIPEMTEEQLANQPVEYYKNGKPKPPKKPVKAKPRTGSLFTSMTVDTVTLDEALQLMSLPRVLGAGRRGQPHHGAERPLRPVPEEGYGLPVHRLGRGNLHHHAGAGAGDLLAAQAARRPCRRAAAGRVRSGPGLGEEHRGEGRPLRPVHHRRRHQHHRAAQPPPWRS